MESTTFNSNTCNGFLIVKKSKFNYDPIGGRYLCTKPPQIGNLLYGGIGRLSLFEISEQYYSNILPGHIKSLYELINKNDTNAWIGLDLCLDENVAFKLLEYSNKKTEKRLLEYNSGEEETDEIIAISGKKLSEYVGEIPLVKSQIEWIGYEPYPLGDLFIMKEGVFKENSPLNIWASSLNEHGLFDNPVLATQYGDEYLKMADDITVEKPFSEFYELDIVRVGRVHYK